MSDQIIDGNLTVNLLSKLMGKVGIGITEPGNKLHVMVGDLDGIRVSGSNSNLGIGLLKGTGDGATPTTYNGALESWYGIAFRSKLDGIVRHTFNTRDGSAYFAGNVGIGTTGPDAKLDISSPSDLPAAVFRSNPSQDNPWMNQLGLSGSGANSEARLGFGTTRADGSGHHTAMIKTVVPPDEGGDLVFMTRSPGFGKINECMRITNKGNVGIGIANPSEKLEVDGNIKVSGDVQLVGADCAEEFDIACVESVEPGTVMVIEKDGALQPCENAYDKRVAGVISGAGDLRPGITLDKQKEQANRLPLALVGKAYCKVDAELSSIELGDLLTTSSTIGHAMKASDPFKAFGSVIGKALRPMETGRGIIPILIALQ